MDEKGALVINAGFEWAWLVGISSRVYNGEWVHHYNWQGIGTSPGALLGSGGLG